MFFCSKLFFFWYFSKLLYSIKKGHVTIAFFSRLTCINVCPINQIVLIRSKIEKNTEVSAKTFFPFLISYLFTKIYATQFEITKSKKQTSIPTLNLSPHNTPLTSLNFSFHALPQTALNFSFHARS